MNLNKHTTFNLQTATSILEVPASRGFDVLAILTEVNPIVDPKEQRYEDRAEKFCGNFIMRKLMGTITRSFVKAAVERMFTADEASGTVRRKTLTLLKAKIVALWFEPRIAHHQLHTDYGGYDF